MRLVAVFLSILTCAFVLQVAICEEAVQIKLSCDGKFEHNRGERYATLEKNVRLEYAELKLECSQLRVDFNEDNRTPAAFSAKGYLSDSDPREVATGRLSVFMPGLKLTARTLDASFYPNDVELREIKAVGDVWLVLDKQDIIVHCAQVDMSRSADGKTAMLRLVTDTSLPNVEIAGRGFVATEREGLIELKGDSYIHTGKQIEITYDIQASKTIIPDDLKKLQAERMVVSAASFDFAPDTHIFRFYDAVSMKFGGLALNCADLIVKTTPDNRLPLEVVAQRGKQQCVMTFREMTIKADKLAFEFTPQGSVKTFNAVDKVAITVIDASERRIEAQCVRAVYTHDLVTLHGDPWVFIQIPSEKVNIREKKCEFFIHNGRWEHRGEGIEAGIDGK